MIIIQYATSQTPSGPHAHFFLFPVNYELGAATCCLGLILISENRRRGVPVCPSCLLSPLIQYCTHIWLCPQFNPSSFLSSAYFSYGFCCDSEESLTMSGQSDFHKLVMTRRLTSKLLLQLPLWSILPFQPTFRCRIHDWTDYPTDSFYTQRKHGGAQKKT